MKRLFNMRSGFLAGALCVAALFLCACTENPDTPIPTPDMSELFENVDDADIDFESKTIVLPEGTQSFTVDNVAALGGSKCFLALDDDTVDPEIDWDNPVTTGKTFEIGEDGLNIVVLDETSRIVAVWHVMLPEEDVASSTSKGKSSSSEEAESSSSDEAESSSSEEDESSSSEEPESSSDGVVESASSMEEESSSSEPEPSASEPVKLSDLSVAK